MTDLTAIDPHKEEDEGYMAAGTGRSLLENPYPRGTIRFEEWRRGWQTRHDAIRMEGGDGYVAAEAGRSLSDNPYPRGTIRFEEWRCGWQTRHEEIRRAQRLIKTRDSCESA